MDLSKLRPDVKGLNATKNYNFEKRSLAANSISTNTGHTNMFLNNVIDPGML
jgi:hypothetical protein